MPKINCPICLGTGKIERRENNRHSYTYEQKEKAAKLYREGMTLRAIAKEMKLKHPQTVQNLIKSYSRISKLTPLE